MPDGPKQEARDEVFRKYRDGEKLDGPFPSRWTCPEVQPWLYGYNAFKEVEDAVRKSPFPDLNQSKGSCTNWTPPLIGRVTSWIKSRMGWATL
jgi:salicylate hydroxylase